MFPLKDLSFSIMRILYLLFQEFLLFRLGIGKMLSLDTHVKDLLPDSDLQGDDLQVEPLREDYDTPGLISVLEKKKS